MAQARVTDFFNTKKRGANIHPSKRQKVMSSSEITTESTSFSAVKSPPVSHRTRAKKTPALKSVPLKNTKLKAPGVKETTTNKKKSVADSVDKVILKNAPIKTEDDTQFELQSKKELISDQPTAACDDHHASLPGTPTKRHQKKEDAANEEISNKRSRNSKCPRKDLFQEELNKTPTKGYDFASHIKKPEEEKVARSKKKLVLKKAKSKENTKEEENTEQIQSETQESEIKEESPSTSQPKEKEKEIMLEKGTKVEKISIEEVAEKVKMLDKAKMKSKLQKSGKLAELQEKLLQFKETQNKAKQATAVKAEGKTDSKERLEKPPAYERFHHLLSSPPPSLTLPFKYKLLEEFFNSTETIVSMLHKRNEICTYSKLKSAVQEMTRRQFDMKHLGQIKHVYPLAYIMRQEKDLPKYGGRASGYQLTVEPDLDNDLAPINVKLSSDKVELDEKGRPSLPASRLLERKKIFHASLIKIVNKYHKEFLNNLERPLKIPDNKITRWHPKFRVDEIPDVGVGPLPEAPDVKTFTTATGVLEQARGKLDPKVQKALENVAKDSKVKSNSNSPNTQDKNITPKKNNDQNNQLKGVSQSLLERIRLKEAKKLEADMTRNPEEEKKLSMLSRLPELVRILRAFYVTQKKPAILLEDAIKNLSSSYKNSLGPDESEAHLNLMTETVPEWISIIKIKRGTFLKIDKNKDMAMINNKLQKLFKEKQVA